jgi:hypothetical protein
LVERQIVVGDFEGQQGHGAGVFVAALAFDAVGRPGAVLALGGDEGIADGVVDAVVVFAAELVGGLGAVVDGVVEEVGAGIVEGGAQEVVAAGEGGRVVVFAEEFQRENADAAA